MGVVIQFKRPASASASCTPSYPYVLVFPWLRQMVYDEPVFRMETDAEYVARLKQYNG